MRLWHIDLIPYLPKSQLLAQWRELNSIYTKQDNHILINYVYNYSKGYLYNYSLKVIGEMAQRGYIIRSLDNFNKYFNDYYNHVEDLRFKEHNNEYLLICYYNLKEKYLRGQKDFTPEIWNNLQNFIYKRG